MKEPYNPLTKHPYSYPITPHYTPKSPIKKIIIYYNFTSIFFEIDISHHSRLSSFWLER